MSRFVLLIALCFLVSCESQPEQKSEPAPQVQFSAADIEAGQALYKKFGCAVCHGRSGRGNGQLARTLNPPPRDFQDPLAYKNGRSVEAISRTILKGALNERGMGMPPYPQITEDQRKQIGIYIASLQKKP